VRKSERTRLLHGPYRSPVLRVGDRATCLYKDGDVVVTTWTDARILWPRCKRCQGKGRPSLLVDEELARAIRTESAAALRFWWGVGEPLVWKGRKALGVGRTDNPGSARLIRAASQKGADSMRRNDWPSQAREERRERAVAGDYAARLQPGYHGPRWTQGELALLGTDADKVIAARIGKSRDAVRAQRVRRKIPPKR
jgi:hypothetical protein